MSEFQKKTDLGLFGKIGFVGEDEFGKNEPKINEKEFGKQILIRLRNEKVEFELQVTPTYTQSLSCPSYGESV